MNNTIPLTVQAISLLQNHIKQLGFTPVIHFELEGCYQLNAKVNDFSLNYQLVNQQLAQADIDGELVAEYWQNQWEYLLAEGVCTRRQGELCERIGCL